MDRGFTFDGRSTQRISRAVRKVENGGASGLPIALRRPPRGGIAARPIFTAYVNEASGVGSTDATFSFDGADGFGGPDDGTGTAQNWNAQEFPDNAPILLVKIGDDYYVIASTGSIFTAYVNEPSGVASGDATFSFDGAIGEGSPAGGAGTASNWASQTMANDDPILVTWIHGVYYAIKPGGEGGSDVYEFAVLGNTVIGAASWNTTTNKRTNDDAVSGYKIVPHSDDDGTDTVDFDQPITLTHGWTEAITIGSNKMRTGWAVGNRVLVLSCTDIDAPPLPEE